MKRNQIVKKSYGVICAKYNTRTKKVEFLIEQKRITFAFTEFIWKHYGKNGKNDQDKLARLFDFMSAEEKMDIASLDTVKIWYRLWLKYPDMNSPDYEKYLSFKNYFEKSFTLDRGYRLREIISRSQKSASLWEIPKGRKANPQEKDINCAVREFQEEAGISPNLYTILFDEEPLTTVFTNDNIKYVNTYYLAIYEHPLKFKRRINYNNISQIGEIIDLQWRDLAEIAMIDTDNRIFPVAEACNKILRKKYRIQKIYDLNLFGDRSAKTTDTD
jgi:8-oxo-dGTP pyrophosphatase MutT (NUDIX family)